MDPICNEPHLYEYFRTPEEKRAAGPRLPTDEIHCGQCEWRARGDTHFSLNTIDIYRRKRKVPLFGWVDVKDALPQDNRYYIVQYGSGTVSLDCFNREQMIGILRWLNYPDPPSPEPTPEQDELRRFVEYWSPSCGKYDDDTTYDAAKAAWMARAKLDRKDKE